MASWQEDYLAALDERDSIEMSNHSIYLAYTKLADRTANAANAANANKEPITELASDAANLTHPRRSGRGPEDASGPAIASGCSVRRAGKA